MGSVLSTPEQEEAKRKQEKEALLEKPWRTYKKNKWTDQELSEMRKEIASYTIPESSGIEHFNVLILGTPQAGKTSFRNTVGSAFAENIKRAPFAGSDGKSLTKKLTGYTVRMTTADEKDTKLKIKFWDTMGYDKDLNNEKIYQIVDGKLKNGAELVGELHKEDIREDSEIERKHKMHCILFFAKGTNVKLQHEENWEKLKDFRDHAMKRGIPCLVVCTHIDKVCQHVREDVSTVFRSPLVKELVDVVSAKSSFDPMNIHPQKNYNIEVEKVTSIDFLTLLLIKQVMECCKEYCDQLEDAAEDY